MTEKDKNEVRWYVVGALGVHQEINIRNRLRLAGIESYVPLRYDIKIVRGHQERKMTPAITGLVFAHTSYHQFQGFAETSPTAVFLRKSSFTGHQEYLTVEEQDMARFIAVTSAIQENITYFKPEEVTLHEGELVEIQLGSKLYEAEILRVKGKRNKQLVVRIPDVTTVSVTLTAELMKLIKKFSSDKQEEQHQQSEKSRQNKLLETGKADPRKTRNVELDKRTMTALARRLLFEVTEDHLEDAENQMAMVELRRLRERLLSLRGFTAQGEGELSLALYLASVCLDVDVEQAEARLRNAIDKLKGVSLLRWRMQLYLARLTHDVATQEAIVAQTKQWNLLRLSARQQSFLEELSIVSGGSGVPLVPARR